MRLILFFLMIVISPGLSSQTTASNKFSIVLPEEWKPKPKFLIKLTRIIKSHVPQLENKDECFGCNADYTVRFNITNPRIYNVYYNKPTHDYTVLFSFGAYMDVLNNQNNLVHRVVLSDTNFVQSQKKKSHRYNSYYEPAIPPPPAPIDLDKNKNTLGGVKLTPIRQYYDPAILYDKNEIAITEEDLWQIAESLIRNYKAEQELE